MNGLAVWDLITLTKEPGDPALQGYSPGHPWYYILGGRPLSVDEIGADSCRNDVLATKDLPVDPGKRESALRRLKAEAERELAQDIERYQELVAQGKAALSRCDILMGYGLETALFLKHNHICYRKSLLAEIKAKLKTNRQKNLFD